MCLLVVTGNLGSAQAGLDLSRLVLAFTPGLSNDDRVRLARLALARAGQGQCLSNPGRVTCLCGTDLDVSAAFAEGHSCPIPRITDDERAESMRLLATVGTAPASGGIRPAFFRTRRFLAAGAVTAAVCIPTLAHSAAPHVGLPHGSHLCHSIVCYDRPTLAGADAGLLMHRAP